MVLPCARKTGGLSGFLEIVGENFPRKWVVRVYSGILTRFSVCRDLNYSQDNVSYSRYCTIPNCSAWAVTCDHRAEFSYSARSYRTCDIAQISATFFSAPSVASKCLINDRNLYHTIVSKLHQFTSSAGSSEDIRLLSSSTFLDFKQNACLISTYNPATLPCCIS